MHPYLNAVVGEYRITGYLGEGGMGQVYRAVHTRLGRVVAIKILSQSTSESVVVQRFLNEARIQASLRHPGVAALYDFTEFQGKPAIIMEYVDGQTIQEITATRGPWKTRDAVPILCSCASTLEYVHSRGIVHRDLKSANLKITSTGDLKLLDFGIATSQTATRLTTAGFVIGTFQSLSPEQANGEPAQITSDIWAFGVLAYEMLTGTLPFEGATQMELFSKIMRASFTPPTVLKPNIPSELERIISRCLRKRPEDRYPSMSALRQDLERVRVVPGAGADRQKDGSDERFSLALLTAKFLSQAWQKWTAAAVGVAAAGLIFVLLHSPGPDVQPQPEDKGPVAASTQPNNNAGHIKQVIVDVPEGSAEVWEGRQMLGHTPYKLSRASGTPVDLTLRQPGYSDKLVQFEVGERTEYLFPMQRSDTHP
jgi:serine/threonine-protein kinase